MEAAADVEPRLHAKAQLAMSRIIAGGPDSMEHTRAALRLFRAEGDNHGASRALVALSIEADQAGERETAADLAREALELARTTDDDWLIAWALSAQVPGIAGKLPGEAPDFRS